MDATLALKRSLGFVMAAAIAATTMLVVTQNAYAADGSVTHVNKDTGNNSTNKNLTKLTKKDKKILKKNARIKHRVKQHGNTGNNSSTKNTDGGKIDTGKITADVTLDNNVNQGDDTALCNDDSDSAVTVKLTNEKTGNKSKNKNNVKITDASKCKVVNNAKVKNSVKQHGNTGGNKSSKNTMAGDIITGDVSFSVSITNTVN